MRQVHETGLLAMRLGNYVTVFKNDRSKIAFFATQSGRAPNAARLKPLENVMARNFFSSSQLFSMTLA
jgi:hypothetical protein